MSSTMVVTAETTTTSKSSDRLPSAVFQIAGLSNTQILADMTSLSNPELSVLAPLWPIESGQAAEVESATISPAVGLSSRISSAVRHGGAEPFLNSLATQPSSALGIGESTDESATVSVSEQPTAKAQMTQLVQAIIKPLLAVTVYRAAECGIRLRKLEWSAFKFRDVKRTDLIYRVWVDANAPQALAFWDYLGEALESWTRRLPRPKSEALKGLSVEVVWTRE